MEKLLTIDEAAELIGFPPNTLRYWRQQRTGPKAAKVGRRVIYRESDIANWVETQFTKTSSDSDAV